MPDLYLVKASLLGGVMALHPDGPESQTVFDKMPVGKSLACEVKQERSVKHLKLYWAICRRIADALDRDNVTHETVDKFFKRSTGLYTVVPSSTFEEGIVQYGSISFGKMDQMQFREYFEKCIRFAYTEWHIPANVFSDLLTEAKR